MAMQKYPSINGLRAISIIFVIFDHLAIQNDIFKNLSGFTFIAPFISLLTDGQLGVNVFFVISGFLITSIMLHEEIKTKTVSLKNFYIRRTLRIFPAYYFLLFVYLVLQLFGYMNISKMSWLTSITYTKYFNWQRDWYTAHAWSLSIEEHFYLFWPLVFNGGKKLRKNISICLIFIVPTIKLILHFYPIAWMNDLTIFLRIDSIATGCFFALYKDEILKIISQHWAKIFYFSIIILFLLPYFKMIADNSFFEYFLIAFGSSYGTIANILIALIMMYSVFGPKRIWYKFLNLKVINYIGLLSYSIYLWQEVFISGNKYLFNKLPFNLVFIALAALGSYYLIEKPFLKLKTRF